jgi:hypothetical protein
LSHKASNVTSQFGEDGIVDAIFERIGTTNKWCLEVGAADGRWFSNTYRLLSQGWHGVLIECDAVQYKKLAERWPGHLCFNLAIEAKGKNSLDNILAGCNAPKELDLISIDIDGDDYHVFKELKEHSARVVILEHCFDAARPRHYVPVPGDRFQAGQCAVKELAEEKGYEVVAVTACNSICVKKELSERVSDVDQRADS